MLLLAMVRLLIVELDGVDEPEFEVDDGIELPPPPPEKFDLIIELVVVVFILISSTII